ncbi:hypothetical protein [Faecalibacter macacae]|uniref:DUF2971 domain-containing protein n=1 Tax=Faecalibacter macacae TaxID=1859289 RepID=A0A3L9MBX9_9FLAO|nr:hypothetical protein [Faecalibacter macacae]RLZ08039.1 hypothetical protein EAH69_10600 [Faecalibacter macacae]
MNTIEKVNHYTSIESLDKILESKKILFKRFDLMDDQTENSGVPEILKKNFFLSCWSKESKEMIPQWEMYAKNGIRIELPVKWYIKHPILDNDGNLVTDFSEIVDKDHPYKYSFFPIPFNELLSGKNYAISPAINETNGFILEVEYCNNFIEKKQQAWVYDSETNTTHLQNLHSLIAYKDEYWDFQKEIRYYLTTICKDSLHEYLPEFILVPISCDALNQIIITLYPNCTQEDELKVIEICEKHLDIFNPDIQIKRSDLDGKFKPKNLT